MPPGDRALWFREQAGVRDELDETVGAKGSAAEVHEGWKIVIGNDIKSLVDALGGCERIQKTPMPFGYLAQQRIFMLIWLVTYPLAIADEYRRDAAEMRPRCGREIAASYTRYISPTSTGEM